jgi:glycosyltransferase involved in cell wall biosynthesis
MPRVTGDESAEHMTLVDTSARTLSVALSHEEPEGEISRYGVPAALRPYWSESEYLSELAILAEVGIALNSSPGASRPAVRQRRAEMQYAGDMFSEVARFTRGALEVCEALDFDIIHAHDWMTFAAGVALRERTGKPLVVHVHSLEYDRSGRNGSNPRIRDLERLGISRADAVVAVSHYTKGIVCEEYGVAPEKVHVVHNGIYEKAVVRHYEAKHPEWPRYLVLFLGRVTFQKGPDYFVQAAAKVVPHVPDVLFVVAGTGDMLGQVRQLARDLGVERYFHFPGFLRGKAVEEMFSIADLYVMPSVSEPFGIAALEAINFDTPVLLSRQSGVSEVLGHSLKFDFWDVNRLADLIINGLIHEELRIDMIEMARKELTRLRWDASASKVMDVYKQLAA